MKIHNDVLLMCIYSIRNLLCTLCIVFVMLCKIQYDDVK